MLIRFLFATWANFMLFGQNYCDGPGLLPEVRHDNYSDSGVLTPRYRAFFA